MKLVKLLSISGLFYSLDASRNDNFLTENIVGDSYAIGLEFCPMYNYNPCNTLSVAMNSGSQEFESANFKYTAHCDSWFDSTNYSVKRHNPSVKRHNPSGTHTESSKKLHKEKLPRPCPLVFPTEFSESLDYVDIKENDPNFFGDGSRLLRKQQSSESSLVECLTPNSSDASSDVVPDFFVEYCS